jgi:iron(III) transport system permease protein
LTAVTHSAPAETAGLPRAESVLGGVTGLIVVLLVLPPLCAVVVHGTRSGFAPLDHLDIVWNTILFGLLTTAASLLIGGVLAFALASFVPGRAVLESLVVMPLYLTPLLTAMGWNWLASPHGGLLNLVLHAAFGPTITMNIVSAAGVVCVSALAAAPLAFLLISDALRGIDASLIEAARVHGGTNWMVLRRIVLPLLLPAVLAAAVLIFVQTVGLFSVPAVLGMPVGFSVATTEIFRLLENYPPDIGDATAWGVFLLAMAALLTFAQSALLSRRSFVTITGKAFRGPAGTMRMGWFGPVLAWLYVAFATVLPLLALLWAASSAFVTADWRLMRFSTQHFAYVLSAYPKTWLAAGNSVLLGALAASIVCLLGLGVSWFVLRGRGPGRALIDQLSMVPLSMPAMVFALGLLWVFVALPLPIYGTIGILLIAYVTHYLPFGVRTVGAALRQLHPELEEAARVSGASWSRTMQRVTLPLTRSSVAAAWILLFVMAMQEVSSSILLYTSHSIVLSVAVFDLWENGNPSDVAALGFVQLAVSFIVVALALGVRQRKGVA